MSASGEHSHRDGEAERLGRGGLAPHGHATGPQTSSLNILSWTQWWLRAL